MKQISGLMVIFVGVFNWSGCQWRPLDFDIRLSQGVSNQILGVMSQLFEELRFKRPVDLVDLNRLLLDLVGMIQVWKQQVLEYRVVLQYDDLRYFSEVLYQVRQLLNDLDVDEVSKQIAQHLLDQLELRFVDMLQLIHLPNPIQAD